MNKEKNLSPIRALIENVFFSSLSGFISKIGAILFTIIIARNFLPEEFGLYSLALTIILSILLLSDFGLSSTLTRYVSESVGKKNKSQARSRFSFLFKVRIFLAFLISVLLFLGAGAIAAFFKKPDLIVLLKLGSIYLLINAIYNVIVATFLAFQKLKYSSITETIFQLSRVILLFILFYFDKTLNGVFVILSVSMLLTTIFSIFVLAKKYPFLIFGKKMHIPRKRMAIFSGFIALSSMNVILFSNIDKLVLGYFLAPKFLGYYTAIFSLVGGALGLLGFTSVLFPIFTQISKDKLEGVFKKIFHYLSILVFPISIGLAFILLPTLKILYGDNYVPAQYAFSLLITSVLSSLLILESSFTGLYTILFNSREYPKIPAFTIFGAALLNISLNIFLIFFLIKLNPSYGLIGASAATVLSRYIGLIVLMIISKKKLGISPDKNSLLKPLFASLVMLLYMIVFTFFIDLTIFWGIVLILGAASIYFIILFLLKEIEIKEIKNILVNPFRQKIEKNFQQ